MFYWLVDTKTCRMPTSSSMCTTVSITALSRTKGKKKLLKDLDSRFITFEANFPLK
jgi:hypothetical protein